MAIENTYLTGNAIQLGSSGFDLAAPAPLDTRTTVPVYAGLAALKNGGAVYEGMRVYVEADDDNGKKGNYQYINGEWKNELAELKTLIENTATAAMEFKGATATLPENPAKGDMYKVAGQNINIKIGDVDAKTGDSIVYNGEEWFLIPSGDDIEDTWRPVTDVNNDATLTFVAGEKLDVAVASNGTVTYSHEEIATTNEGTETETRTYISSITTDGYGHITGYKTATENVEDTNTTYTFEGQSDEATSVYFQVTSSEENADTEVIYLDTYSKNEIDLEFAKKVDKVAGYSLVSDTEIARLAEVDNYDDEEVRGLIGDNAKAIEDLKKYVGTIPTDEAYKDITNVIGYINKKSEETLAAASGNSTETAASVKQQLDNYKSENNTRVKAVEDAIDTIAATVSDHENRIGTRAVYDDEGEVVSDGTGLAGDVEQLETTLVQIVDLTNNMDQDVATLSSIVGNYTEYDEDGNLDREASGLAGEVELLLGDENMQGSVAYEVRNAKEYADGSADRALKDAKSYADGSAAQALKDSKDYTDGLVKDINDEIADINDVLYGDEPDQGPAGSGLVQDVDSLKWSLAYIQSDENNEGSIDHAIKTAKDYADGLAGNYAKAEHEHVVADITDFETTVEARITAKGYATTGEVAEAKSGAEAKAAELDAALKTELEAKFADYTKTADLPTDLGDFTNNAGYAKTADVNTELDKKADKSVVEAMYTNDQIDGFIAEAKKYADDNDADTKYGIVYDSDNKKIKLVEGGTDVEIDATAFIKDGMIESVALSEDGLNLVITWNTDSDKGENNVTTIPLTGLVDIYTGVEGARVKVTVASDKSISADLVVGSISKDYLDASVKASLALADSAIQAHQDVSHLATTEALNGVDAKFANYTNTTDMNAALELKADKTQVATDIATAKSGAETKAAELDAALKSELQAEIDADVKVLADNVYTKAQVYTQAEVDALISAAHTWGEF